MNRRSLLKSLAALPLFSRAVQQSPEDWVKDFSGKPQLFVPNEIVLTAHELAGPGLTVGTGCVLDINVGCGIEISNSPFFPSPYCGLTVK